MNHFNDDFCRRFFDGLYEAGQCMGYTPSMIDEGVDDEEAQLLLMSAYYHVKLSRETEMELDEEPESNE